MALIDDVKDVLKESGAESTVEIQDLIDFAKADIKSVGVLEEKIIETDMMIKRAINLYCKANFSYEDPKISERFQTQYESLKTHLALSIEYTVVAI